MQIPIIPSRGQRKPWGSIPRINWGHPLVRGMVFYGYDTGTGLVVDLISGANAGVLTTAIPNAPSKFGTGRKYASGGGAMVFPLLPAINSMLATNLYSLACAWNITVLPSVAFTCPFTVSDSTFVTVTGLLFRGAASNDMQFAVNNTNPTPFTANSINTFHSLVGTNTSATAQSVYYDGAIKATTAITAAATTTTARVCFNSGDPAALNGNGVAGLVYYGAIWNRTVTAAEAFQLHNDPYCFLIYPEDEIFASLTGATAPAPPGPGPNFLTSQLPMMGVG